MKRGTKQYRNYLDMSYKTEGKARRLQYAKEILHKAPTIPKPLDYKDIDEAFVKFVENDIDLTINGSKIPTFTLFSNQRFSEYSQTWSHTDDEGNLILNFKTVSRNTDLKKGSLIGESYNIPGDRWFEVNRRVVLDDNGTEHYEIISMRQPFTIDFSYRIGFVTDKFEELNNFNSKINKIFKSRQYYIRPNGHYIPLILDGITDESQHSVEDRKFYSQVVVIKALGYIINEDDYRVDMIPRRVTLLCQESTSKKKPKVTLEENDITEEYANVGVEITIDFDTLCTNKSTFKIDTDAVITKVATKNVRQLRVHINDTPYYYEDGFELKDGDEVRLKITPFNEEESANVTFIGYVPKDFIRVNWTPEDVNEEPENNFDEIYEE